MCIGKLSFLFSFVGSGDQIPVLMLPMQVFYQISHLPSHAHIFKDCGSKSWSSNFSRLTFLLRDMASFHTNAGIIYIWSKDIVLSFYSVLDVSGNLWSLHNNLFLLWNKLTSGLISHSQRPDFSTPRGLLLKDWEQYFLTVFSPQWAISNLQQKRQVLAHTDHDMDTFKRDRPSLSAYGPAMVAVQKFQRFFISYGT